MGDRLKGKVALVTGGSRGQGEAEVRCFVREGARVYVADLLEEPGEKLAAELGEAATFVAPRRRRRSRLEARPGARRSRATAASTCS